LENTVLYSVLSLVVETICGVLAGVLLLRFWMQAIRVRPPSSISQFLYQTTDWLVKPLRRVLPGVGGYDWASLIGAVLFALISTVFDIWMTFSFAPHTVLLLTLLRVIQWILYGFIGLLIIEVIFSWVNPQAPLAPFVRALNEPLMRPLRRVIPPLGGIDLSPLVAFLLLRVALFLATALIIPLL
jgi:YggT family protein